MVYDPSPSLAKFPSRKEKKKKKNQQMSLHGPDQVSLCVSCQGTLQTKS